MPRSTTSQLDALDSPPASPQLLTVAEVADQLRVDPYTVRRWIGRGELAAYRIGRELRIQASELARYLDGRRA